jgi:predicted small lipoprotein YifL
MMAKLSSSPAATVALFTLLAGCSRSGPVSAAPAASPPDSQSTAAAPVSEKSPADSFPWLVADSAERTVTLDLEVTARPGAGSALINGYRSGELRIVVPAGWTMGWNWRSSDPSAPHSLVVMVQREKIPLEGGRPSFSNAMTRMVTEGLRPGQTDRSTFEAEEAGWYWMMCGVPSHGLNGEWLELRVDAEAKTARAETKKKA